jgi:hypothetical protein
MNKAWHYKGNTFLSGCMLQSFVAGQCCPLRLWLRSRDFAHAQYWLQYQLSRLTCNWPATLVWRINRCILSTCKICRWVIWRLNDVSGKLFALIFMVKSSAQLAARFWWLLNLLNFYPEEGGNRLLWHSGIHRPTAHHNIECHVFHSPFLPSK